MVRSLGAIVCAVLLSQPGMQRRRAEGYARVVREEARLRHFDPFTMISMVHWESRWIASVGNRDCLGLGGVCLSNYRCCQTDPQGICCAGKRSCLLDGACNLRESARAITANRVFCRRKTGRAGFHHWLAGYQGYNRPSSHIFCGQRRTRRRWVDVAIGRLTRRVMRYRRRVIRRCGAR